MTIAIRHSTRVKPLVELKLLKTLTTPVDYYKDKLFIQEAKVFIPLS